MLEERQREFSGELDELLAEGLDADRRVDFIHRSIVELDAELRRRGVLIIHCPSETMDFYKDTPQRQLAQNALKVDLQEVMQRCLARVPQREPPLPIDDSDGGCDDQPPCKTGSVIRSSPIIARTLSHSARADCIARINSTLFIWLSTVIPSSEI